VTGVTAMKSVKAESDHSGLTDFVGRSIVVVHVI